MNGLRIVGAALILVLAGCGYGPFSAAPGVEVSGKVLRVNGAPLAGGTLVLRPVGGIHGASAQIQPDGSFSLVDQTGKKSVVPGKYEVYVRFNDPNHKTFRSLIHRKYQDSEDGESDVVVEIQKPNSGLIIRLRS